MTNAVPVPKGAERLKFKGNIVAVFTQVMSIGGKLVTFERASRAPGVRLIILNGDKILLTKEYRSEHGTSDYRLPGGKVFDKLEEYLGSLDAGKDLTEIAKLAAIKEAREETGLAIKSPSLFHLSKCGATVDWDLYYFVCEATSTKSKKQKLELGEDISIGWYDFVTAEKIALSGEMKEDRSIGVLLRFLKSKSLN